MARIHCVIDVPVPHHDAAGAFWAQVLGWELGPPWTGHPELCSFLPPQGATYVHLQEVGGPPGVHLDVESGDPGRTVGRAVELGATMVGESDLWRTLRSPGGLPFCVVREVHHHNPEPMSWPGGHRSRLVQVCIDSPAAVHDQEAEFWRALLAGRWVSSSASEFAGKWHDDAGSPLQLLFQRLDEPAGPVRAHLDHGTDDLQREVHRILGLGAEDVGPGRGWHTLRDPAGLAFCVTANSPEQVRHRDIG